MDCMDLFYKMEGKDMYVEKVYTGSVVAAPYYHEGYHRVKVISVVKNIIGVSYIDFGTVGVVKKDQLRILPGMFRALPSQAIECFLWGVEDRVGMARERFRELVEKGNMCGGFVAIIKRMEIVDEEVKAGLWLVDTASNSLPDGVSNNYLLLEEGLVMQAVGIGTISSTGELVSNMSTSSSSLLAAVDQELANCRYVQRLDMGGVDIHIINLMGEAWVTSDWQRRDILAPMLARKKV